MSWIRRLAVVAGAGAGAAALLRRVHRPIGHDVPGGTLIGDVGGYDRNARWLFGGFYNGIAANVVAAAASGDRILEVGCGPGHLAIRLARGRDIEVTGLDLDPDMIERARANASKQHLPSTGTLEFVVGDVARLPFPDASFDLVVSTMSMHHWADAATGLGEIRRVLRPGGRALIWDFRPGGVPFHPHMPDPIGPMERSSLRVANVEPWRWPWRFELTRRIELLRKGEGGGVAM